MECLVVLQTHALGDSQHYLKKQRYCEAAKPEVMRRCVASLVHSINVALDVMDDLTIKLMVFDDHSDEASLANLRAVLRQAECPHELVSLETRGIMPSILACYRHGLEAGRDWVYFVQDDYLYEPEAIAIMLRQSLEFSTNLGEYVSIYPFNDPYRYLPVNVGENVHIVRGGDRHWRTNYHTASCFMTHHEVIRTHWDLFERFGSSEVSPTMEDDSINQLFIRRGLHLFTPIPSLALHLQYDTEQDPFIDWRTWWDRHAEVAKT